ncbi:thiamine transporter 1 isoform X2 [Folsomia candida]|nr:thiamine transporter 1 isoform X2 [Folsomia candida]
MYILTWAILILGSDLEAIIWVEVFYGIACSTEVAYYTYTYAKVEKDRYKKVTSHTSSALYAGKFVGGLLAQLLVTFQLMNYHQLTCLTLAFSILGFIATLFLPKVKSSIYFHRYERAVEQPGVPVEIPVAERHDISTASRLWNDFMEAYSNTYILKWSLWWALASAGQYQVVNYIQVLWEQINQETQLEPYNGVVKALHTLLSAVLCLAVGYVKLRWSQWGERLLGILSLLQGGLLVWMARSSYLYTAYICYTVFRTIHPVMLTIASAEVAQGISKDSHGLVFGINTFLALLLQTLLTIVVSDEKGLALDVKQQFIIYGGYFSVLGAAFVLASAWSSAYLIYRKKSHRNRFNDQLPDNAGVKFCNANEPCSLLDSSCPCTHVGKEALMQSKVP